jgi:DNA end-binding protein Ku
MRAANNADSSDAVSSGSEADQHRKLIVLNAGQNLSSGGAALLLTALGAARQRHSSSAECGIGGIYYLTISSEAIGLSEIEPPDEHQRTRVGLRRIGPHQPALLPARWSVNAAGALGGACNETEKIAVVPARPYWKGYLKLSLVTCPIALYTASSSTERVSFRQINKQTGNRLRQQLVDEVTREPVEGPDKGRGFEYAKNAYIPVEDDELDAIAIESNHTIEIDSFVPREQIDQRYLDSPFYITPNDQAGQDAFAVIREAMRGKGLVALGRVVLAKRERVIMLEPWDKGVMGTTLRYPYEIRDAKEYFGDIPNMKVEPDMLKLAEHILQNKAADFDPSRFVDRYEDAVVEMLRKKQAGIEVSCERAAPRPQNLVNLTEALRRSVAQEDAAPAPSKKGHKRVQGQGEMLLHIASKKSKEAQPKSAGRPSIRHKHVG